MPLSIRLVFLLIAAVCFALGALGVPTSHNWTDLGLLFLTIAFMV